MIGELIAFLGIGAGVLCGLITMYGVIGEALGWWPK